MTPLDNRFSLDTMDAFEASMETGSDSFNANTQSQDLAVAASDSPETSAMVEDEEPVPLPVPDIVLKISDALIDHFEDEEIPEAAIESLVSFIEQGKQNLASSGVINTGIGEINIRICVIRGDIFLFFGKTVASGHHSAAELAFNYSSGEKMVLYRARQSIDTPTNPLTDQCRKKCVRRFNDSLLWYAKYNNTPGLVRSWCMLELSNKTPQPYQHELGIIQPAYNGNLEQFIVDEDYEEKHLINLFHGVLGGLQRLHADHLAHRQIAIEKILYKTHLSPFSDDSFSGVLGGFAFMTSEDSTAEWMSKLPYNKYAWAPEYWNRKTLTQIDYQRGDLWAMGIAMYQVLTQDSPYWITEYEDMDDEEKSREDRNRFLSTLGGPEQTFQRFKDWHNALPETGVLWPIIKRMLDLNPETRLTAAEAYQQLSHAMGEERPHLYQMSLDDRKSAHITPQNTSSSSSSSLAATSIEMHSNLTSDIDRETHVEKRLKIWNAINRKLPNNPVSIDAITNLINFIESKKHRWPTPETFDVDANPIVYIKEETGLPAHIYILKGHIILLFRIVISARTTYNAVEFGYDYTTDDPLVMLRLRQPADNAANAFEATERPGLVQSFNDTSEFYRDLNHQTGLVDTLARTRLKMLLEPGSENEVGIIQPAYKGDLFTFIDQERYNDKDLTDLVKLILQGIHNIHKQKKAHRDIKPANILYTPKIKPSDRGRYNAAITDYGLMTAYDNNSEWLHRRGGTFQYRSPEYWHIKKPTLEDHQRMDMWALGITLHELVTKKRPFWSLSYEAMLKAKKPELECKDQLIWLGGADHSYARFKEWHAKLPQTGYFWPMISRLLDLNPETRLTAEQANALFGQMISEDEGDRKASS